LFIASGFGSKKGLFCLKKAISCAHADLIGNPLRVIVIEIVMAVVYGRRAGLLPYGHEELHEERREERYEERRPNPAPDELDTQGLLYGVRYASHKLKRHRTLLVRVGHQTGW
jgi:hypothetical protein